MQQQQQQRQRRQSIERRQQQWFRAANKRLCALELCLRAAVPPQSGNRIQPESVSQQPAPLVVAVAGVPRSHHAPQADGRWLTAAQQARIRDISDRIVLIHTTRTELESGRFAGPSPEVLLVEVGADPWYEEEIPASALAQLVTPSLRWVALCSSGIGHVTETGIFPDEVC